VLYHCSRSRAHRPLTLRQPYRGRGKNRLLGRLKAENESSHNPSKDVGRQPERCIIAGTDCRPVRLATADADQRLWPTDSLTTQHPQQRPAPAHCDAQLSNTCTVQLQKYASSSFFLLSRIAHTERKHAAYCDRRSMIPWSASAGHELCQNGWTDRDAVRGVESGAPEKPWSGGDPNPPRENILRAPQRCGLSSNPLTTCHSKRGL